MPPGCWPAAQTSSSSKNASDTGASPTTQQNIGTLPDAGDRALVAFRQIRYGRKTKRVTTPMRR